MGTVATPSRRLVPTADACSWKQMGTTCESLPEAHKLLRGFNAVCRIAAPSLLFKSEAIVHPDFVVQYIDQMECQLSYNPLQMALIWEGLACRDASMLSQALERRHNIANGCAWVNYMRSHDDIGCECYVTMVKWVHIGGADR